MATQSLRTQQLAFIFNGSYRTTTDYDSIAAKFDHNWAIALAAGTGSGQANFAYQDSITIAASSSTTVDLFALTDAFGNVVAPTICKVLAIRLKSSAYAAASLNVGAAAANIFSPHLAASNDIFVVRYQGWVIFVAKDATAFPIDATHRNLKILNNSTTQSVDVDLVVVGVK